MAKSECFGGTASCPWSRPAVRKGNVLARYVLEDELGSGALGIVRKGRPKKGNRLVAVKTIRLKDSEGSPIFLPQEEKQFLTEIEITFKCRHPNIIRTYEAWQSEKTLDIVMEFAMGGEVAATFARADRHSEMKAKDILGQVCKALDYLHAQSIAHRDIKPENVVYMDGMQELIKIVDFGYAISGMHNTQLQDKRRTLVGTAPFMAPELFQAVEGSSLRVGERCVEYSIAVDMWAVGVFAYLVLFGLLPYAPEGRFLADFKEALSESHIFHFPDELVDDFSAAALDFMSHCLDKDPQRRLTAREAVTHRWFTGKLCDEGPRRLDDNLPHFELWQQNARRSLLVRDKVKNLILEPSPGAATAALPAAPMNPRASLNSIAEASQTGGELAQLLANVADRHGSDHASTHVAVSDHLEDAVAGQLGDLAHLAHPSTAIGGHSAGLFGTSEEAGQLGVLAHLAQPPAAIVGHSAGSFGASEGSLGDLSHLSPFAAAGGRSSRASEYVVEDGHLGHTVGMPLHHLQDDRHEDYLDTPNSGASFSHTMAEGGFSERIASLEFACFGKKFPGGMKPRIVRLERSVSQPTREGIGIRGRLSALEAAIGGTGGSL